MSYLLPFYMVGTDERRFHDFAVREQGLVIVAGIQAEEASRALERLPAPTERWWQRMFLVPRGHAAAVRYRRVPARDYYTLDPSGPAIPWTRSGLDERGKLVRGSISLNTDRSRPHEVELSYRKLDSWIRTQFRKIPGEGIFAGPEAWTAWITGRAARR